MLNYNEIKLKKYIVFEGEPFEVLDSHVFRKQQRKPVNATKMKSLISGRVLEHSFHQNEKVEEADIEKRNIKFIYSNKGEAWFSEENDSSKRFSLPAEKLGSKLSFMNGGVIVEAQSFNGEIIDIKLPIKVVLSVKDAPPGLQGDRSNAGNKQVTLENGLVINVPLFINSGDTIRINTDTGDYVERVTKS